MPTTISGIPLHPLIVHAVVVLVPLSVLAALAMAVSGRVRDRYGWLFTGIATVALIFVPMATSTGEGLRAQVEQNAAIARHAELGDQLLPLMGLLWLSIVGMMLVHRWRRLPADGPGTPGATVTRPRVLATVDRVGTKIPARRRGVLQRVVALLAVLLAVATGVQVYRIGDSGAKAVWHGVGSSQHGGSGDGDGDAS